MPTTPSDPIGYLVGRNTPIGGYSSDAKAYQQQLNNLNDRYLKLQELRQKYVSGEVEHLDNRTKYVMQGLSDIANAMSKGMEAVAMSQQARADIDGKINDKLSEFWSKMLAHQPDTQTVTDYSANTAQMRDTLAAKLDQAAVQQEIARVAQENGGLYVTDAQGQKTLNPQAVNAIVGVINGGANGPLTSAVNQATQGLAKLDNTTRANTALQLMQMTSDATTDALRTAAAKGSLNALGISEQDAANIGAAAAKSYTDQIANSVGTKAFQDEKTYETEAAEGMTAFWNDISKNYGQGNSQLAALTEQARQKWIATINNTNQQDMKNVELAVPTYIQGEIDKTKAAMDQVQAAALKAGHTPEDPVLAAVQDMRTRIPHFDTWQAAMRFRDSMHAAIYAADHPHEVVDFLKMMKADPSLANNVPAVRERLHAYGEQQGFGYYTSPVGRLLQLGHKPAPGSTSLGGTATAEPPKVAAAAPDALPSLTGAVTEVNGQPTAAAPPVATTASSKPIQGKGGWSYVRDPDGNYVIAEAPARYTSMKGTTVSKDDHPTAWAAIDEEVKGAEAKGADEVEPGGQATQEPEDREADAREAKAQQVKEEKTQAQQRHEAEQAQSDQDAAAKEQARAQEGADAKAQLKAYVDSIKGANIEDSNPQGLDDMDRQPDIAGKATLPKVSANTMAPAASTQPPPPMTQAERAAKDPLGLRLASMARLG